MNTIEVADDDIPSAVDDVHVVLTKPKLNDVCPTTQALDNVLDRMRQRCDGFVSRGSSFALKAILQILSNEEPLTLTGISQRLERTPGSTKDYLSWLADVDLLNVRQKRYCFADPVLRLWVRLHGHATPPNEEDLAREVQEYAVSRFPYMEPGSVSRNQPVSAENQPTNRDRAWNLVEID